MAHSGITDWSNTGLFINLSSGFYLAEMERLEEAELDEEDRALLAEEPWGMQLRNQKYEKMLIPLLGRLSNLSVEDSSSGVFFKDQTGIIQAMRAAIIALQEKELGRCIVGGIDSYIEDYSLAALDRFNVLKTPPNPAGFTPGECAAFILLEEKETAVKRGANVESVIEALHESSESSNRLLAEPPIGRALANAVMATLKNAHDGGQDTGLIIGDLNGDVYRAYDWGSALTRLKVDYPFIGDLPEWYPALSFGEIGAATGPAAICLGVRGFARGYAKTDNILVWLSSDTGMRGAFYIRKYRNRN
jgi:3-oxoacyl-[acyl-carrier-protein] synthase-1